MEPRAAQERFGTPVRGYHFEDYTIMVYDYNLLRKLTVPAGPWPGFQPG